MMESNKYEIVIGLEVHAQLLTRSKMFCSCPADYIQGSPNTVVCPVCLALPGVLPVINRRAVEYVIMTGLALNATIAQNTQFHRKNYPYPDLMKGYQISQYDEPVATVVPLAADDRHTPVTQRLQMPLHCSHHLTAGVLHQHGGRNPDLVDRATVGVAHLGAGQDTHGS